MERFIGVPKLLTKTLLVSKPGLLGTKEYVCVCVCAHGNVCMMERSGRALVMILSVILPPPRTWVAEASQGSVWLSATEGRASRKGKPEYASTGNSMHGFPTEKLWRGGIRLKARNLWKPAVPVGKKDKAGGRGSGSGDYVSPGMLATLVSLIGVLTRKGWQYEMDTRAIRGATQVGARLSLAPAYFSSHLPVSHRCFLLWQARSLAPAAFGVSLWLQSLGGDLQGKGKRSAQRETGGEADRERPGQVLRLRLWGLE